MVVLRFLFFETIDADSFDDKSEAVFDEIDEAEDENETSEAVIISSKVVLVLFGIFFALCSLVGVIESVDDELRFKIVYYRII